jgi:hypothetical protein
MRLKRSDVFPRVDEQVSKDDTTVKIEANANADKRENDIRSIKSSSPTMVSSNIDPHDDDKKAEPEPIKKSPHLTGAQLILQQFYAILVKRAKHTMRKWKMYLTLV